MICLFRKSSSRKNRDVPTGYVEFLETRYQLLAEGLREAHSLLVSASLLPSIPNDITTLDSPTSTQDDAVLSQTSIQTILSQLGVSAPADTCCGLEVVPDCERGSPPFKTDHLEKDVTFESFSFPSASSDSMSPGGDSPILDDVVPSTTLELPELSVIKAQMPFQVTNSAYLHQQNFWSLQDGTIDPSGLMVLGDMSMDLAAMDMRDSPMNENVLQDSISWDYITAGA